MPALDKKPDLKPCPFCGADLDVKWARNNPSARCVTADCMGAKLPVICLDVPGSIEAWNTRAAARETPFQAGQRLRRELMIKSYLWGAGSTISEMEEVMRGFMSPESPSGASSV